MLLGNYSIKEKLQLSRYKAQAYLIQKSLTIYILFVNSLRFIETPGSLLTMLDDLRNILSFICPPHHDFCHKNYSGAHKLSLEKLADHNYERDYENNVLFPIEIEKND